MFRLDNIFSYEKVQLQVKLRHMGLLRKRLSHFLDIPYEHNLIILMFRSFRKSV